MPVLRIYILTLTLLCTVHCGYSQCPFPVSLSSRGNCPGDTLAIRTDFTLIQIVWLRDGVVDKVILNAPADTLYKTVQSGSYTASVSDNEGCTVTIGPVVIKGIDNSDLFRYACEFHRNVFFQSSRSYLSMDGQWGRCRRQ